MSQDKKKPSQAESIPKGGGPARSKGTLLSLESRLMFDAAAAATAAEVNQEQVAQEQAEAAVSAESSSETQESTASQDLLQAFTTYLPVESRQEIAFIDPTVPNYQALLSGMDSSIEIIMLDGGQDGIEQMASALAERTGIDAIHVISHGDPGTLQLGTGTLTVVSMAGEYADELATIKQALSEQADLLVYGCDFAEGDAGQVAVNQLATLTGADVQASSDLTGNLALGGDWELEFQIGTIETQVAVSDDAQMNWVGLLAETWMDAATGNVIAGPVGNDWYVGDSANNTPVSSAGGADIMYGAGGDDTLTSGSGNDILVGGTGNDTISGGSDDDVILGGTGNDHLDGGSAVGKNTLIGGGGNDQMVGGSGADVFRFTGAQSGDAYTVDGGGSTDIIDLSEFSTATITNSGGVITVDRGGGNVFTITHANVESIVTAATVGNHGPLADAGSDQTVATSATVTLTAAGSSDRDGNSLTYQWTQIEGPKVTLSSSTAASPTFTAPSSTTTLQFVVVVSDGTTSHADTVTINVTSNSAPTITSNSGGATAAISVAENTTSVTTVTATDANAGQTLTYSISGGADAAKFSINSSTGALSFASAPNYESPTDSGGNNVYDVTVQVSDGQGGVDSQAISVTVTDAANEAPTDLSSGIELNIAGGNDAFLISDTGLPQSLTATTVEIRFAANDTPYEPVFISFNNPTGDELAIQIDEPSKNLEIDFGSGAVASASAINYRAALVDGAVHTLSVTWENTTGNWGVYIDGVFIDSGTGLSTGSPLDTTNGRFVFGQEQDAQNSGYDSTQYFSGTFYDVRIWNDVRTAGEIAQYYQQQLDVTPAEAAAVGLVANWQMDGFNGSNQVVEVVSGNNLSIAHASGTGFTAGAADSQLSIQENSANGSHIGFVTSEDPDASETFSYSLTDSASGRFAVNSATGEITVANGMLLDYDTATSHNITVRVTDSGGLTYDETFTINLTNVNETPTDLSLSSNTVAENAANGTVVGTVSGSDPDSGDTKTYSLTDTAGGRFAIDSSTGVLTVADGSLLDFENGASHTVTVRVTDSGGLTYDEVFTINVTNVNEAPVAADDRAGLTFDGVDDFVHMGSGAVYEVTDTVTMEAWINREPSSQVSQIIINKEGEYEIGLDADGSLKWAFANTNPGWAWHDTGVVIPVHAWTHIAVTYDHGTITSYVNGVVVETFAGSGTIGDAHPTKDSLRIGGRENNPANQYFSGQIAEVQVWNVSRTAGEVAADLNGTLTGSETGLLGYWKFNENTGATADNLTGNSDGTLGDGILGQTPQWATYRVTEDTTLVSSGSGVLGNDYDIDGDALSAIIDTGPSHASAFTLNADGSFSYTPAANFYGTDSFTYRVSDGTNLSNVATVYIQVDPVNDVPSDLILSTNTVVENASNGTVVGSVGGTDPDSGDTMTYSITDSAGGRFAINSSTGQLTVADGSLLNYESATSHNITVRVTDAGGLTYDETFTINVTNVNEAPTGADTTITINEDTSHTLTTGNFGFSDVDVGDGLSAVRIDTLPTTGNLTLSGVAVTAGQVITVADIMAGNLVFTPAADTNGTGYANFTFSVRDSNNAYDVAPNTLTFDVTPVNDAPIRTSGTVSNLTVSEDAGLASLGLAGVTYSNGGSTDESGQTLTYAVTVIPSPSAGDVFLADGTTRVIVGSYTLAEIQGMQFKPATNATGVTAFQFNVYDSGGTANGGADTISEFILITVTAVNDAPTITNLSSDSLSYNEGDGAVVIEQGGNALVADVDSSNLDTGTLVVSIPSGGDSAEDVLSIRNEGTSAGQIGVSGSTITYGGTTIGTFTGGSSGSNLVITLNSNATPTAVTALIKNITYENTDTASPTTGARTVRYVLTDGDGGTSANYDTTVTVSGVNDAPTISYLAGDTQNYTEGAGAVIIEQGFDSWVQDVDSSNFDTGTLTVSIPSGGDSAEDVLSIRHQGTAGGQIGVSGSTITYSGVTIGTFTGGTSGMPLVVTLNSNATATAVDALVLNITYENTDTAEPTTGVRTVRYILTDGDGGTSANYDTTVTVSGVNDAPVITPIAPDVTFVEGGLPQVIDATGTITDVDSTNFDGGVMTVSISANGSADDRLGVGNWGTGPGQVGGSGSDVTYGGTVIGTVSGGTSGSDPLIITFNTSATPTAVQEVYRSIQFNNVSDNPSTATRTLTIGLTDGDGGTATPQTKLVYVQGTNDAPVLTFGEGDKNFTEGALAVMIDALPNVSDLDSTNFDTGTLTITISANPSVDDRVELLNTGMGAGQIGVSGTNVYYGGTLIGTQAGGIGAVPFVVTFNANTDAAIVGEVMANIRFWVAGDAPSTATRTIEAVLTDGDGGTSLTASKQITVTAVNDPTVVTGGTSGTGNEDTTLTGTLTATDAEGLSDGSVFTVSGAATNGTASIDPATGLWSYTPNADFNGTDSFTVTITDDAGNTTTQVISVTVTPVVDITDDNLTTTEDTAISANVLTGTNGATADSFEGTPVLTSVTQGANGSVTFLTNGTVTYTPNANFNGTDSFTYTITSGGVTETATVTVTVTAVDDPTVVTGGTSGTGNEDTTITGTLTATDADGLSDGTVFTVSTGATQGTASIDPATGLWSYTPNADYDGSDSFTVTITDDAGNTSTHVISVTVMPVNDAPVVVVNSGSTVAEGGTDMIDASELAVTDVDTGAAQLTYSIGTGPSYGWLELITAPGVSATTFTQADIAANRLLYVHDGSETTSDSFTFTVNDGAGGSLGLTTVTLTITPVNDTPTIMSNGGGVSTSITVAENISVVTIVTGADVDLPTQALTYSISGGVDQALFTINTTTGALSFTAPPDFEVATDANGDNVYVVQVQVVDSQGASTTQTIQVTVTDVAEGVPLLPPTVPPVLLSPLPLTGGPTPGLGTPAPADPVTPVAPGSGPTPVPPGSTGLPVNVEPLSLVPPTDRPVTKLPEEPNRPTADTRETPLFLVSDDQGRPLFSVLPVEPAPTLEPEAPKITPSVSDLLLAKLDEMTVSLEQAVNVSQERHELMARVAAVTGTTLSVGFVAWALRSGAILASMLATMPAWQHFDPLPVVKLSRHERGRRRDEATRAQQQEAAEFKGLNQVLDKAPPLKRTA